MSAHAAAGVADLEPVRVDADEVEPDGGGRLPALAAVLIVLVALASLPFQRGLPGVATVELASGAAEVELGGGWQRLRVGQQVGPGSRIRTLEGREATFLVDDGRLELLPGTTYVLDGLRRATVERGSLLLAVDDLWQVEVGIATVRGQGLVRVDVGALRRAAVYRGGASVSVVSASTSVEALDQVDLADVDLVEPEPLAYDAADPWDARFLATAIDVDEDVAALQRGLAAQYGDALQTPAFYADFLEVDDLLATALPDLAPREDGDRFGPAAPTLTAVVVARTLETGARLSQGEAVAEIRRERGAGATWGLILVDHELGPRALAAATEEALRRRAIAVDEGRAASVQRPAPVPGTPAGATPPREGDPERSPPPTPPPSGSDPDPGPGPEPTDDPSTVPEPVDDLVDEVVGDTADDPQETVDDLLGTIPVPGGDLPVEPGDVALP